MKILTYIGLFVMMTLISTSIFSEPASQESIKKLMQKTGAGDLSVQMMNQMIPALKKMVPEAPESFWTEVVAEFNADEIVNMIIPIYQKYLTEEDIVAINTFYDTPAGKKMIESQPAIMQESMIVGQQWGQKVAQDVLEKYQAQSDKKL